MHQYSFRFVWAAGEADMNVPHEAQHRIQHLACSPQEVVLVVNDYDYILQGGNWQVALTHRRTDLGPKGRCYVATPDDVLQHLHICKDNAPFVPILAQNDYSRCGLPGIGIITACKALRDQPPLQLSAVLELPQIASAWARLSAASQSAVQDDMENAALAFGASPLVNQNADSNFSLQIRVLPG